MISCYFNFDSGKFHFNFPKSHQYFTDLVEFFKQNHCSYSPQYQEWTELKSINVLRYLDELKAYDEVQISEEDKLLISDSIYPLPSNLHKTKFPIDKFFFEKFPPIIGKPGFEDFQMQTIRYLLSQNHGIVDVGVGHGKTYVISAVLHHLLWKSKIDKILWVCKFEGLLNTKLEILRFLGHWFTESDIAIITTEDRDIEKFFDKKIILISYNTFKLSSSYAYQEAHKPKNPRKPRPGIKVKKKLIPKRFTKPSIDFSSWGSTRIAIYDEGQSLKNHDTQINHHIKLYSQFFYYQYAMSGTLGYELDDYYSIGKIFCDQLIPFAYSDWRPYIYGKDRRVTKPIPERAKEFKERVINLYQVSFHDCIVAPPMIEKEIYLEMSPKMRSIYQQFVEKTIDRTRSNSGVETSAQQLKNTFPTLLQAVSDISLVAEEFGISWNFKDSPKLEAVESLLDQWIGEEKRKVLIWINYPRIANLLSECLKKYKPLVIHGDIPTSMERSERSLAVEEWKKDPNRHLGIFSYVLATSQNITEATRQIYFDCGPDSDPRDQSKGRIRRATSKEPTISVSLLYNRSLDVYVYFNILKTKSSIKKVLNSKEELDIEDYKNVFMAKAEDYVQKGYQTT